MTLIKADLKSNILDLLKELSVEEDKDASLEKFADRLSSIIDNYIKTGTVTVAAGIAVATSGGAGSTSAIGTGTIS